MSSDPHNLSANVYAGRFRKCCQLNVQGDIGILASETLSEELVVGRSVGLVVLNVDLLQCAESSPCYVLWYT
eukprot:2438593-Amphidinium_carterae.1